MKIKHYIQVMILGAICLLGISCTDNRMKYYCTEEGTELKMNAIDNFYIEFSQKTDELIVYPNQDYEMIIPYTIIGNNLAMKYISSIQFDESYNEKKYSALVEEEEYTYFYYCAPFIPQKQNNEAEYHYWIFIKTQVENEDSFRYYLEIEDDVARNTLSDKLKLYEYE